MDFEKLAEGLAAFRKEAKAPRYIRGLMKKGITPKDPGVQKYIDEVKKGKQLSSDFKAHLPKHEGKAGRVFSENPDLNVIKRRQISEARKARRPQTQTLADAVVRQADKMRKQETAGVKGKFKAFRRALRGESTTPKADLWEHSKLRKLTDKTRGRRNKTLRELERTVAYGKDPRKLYNQSVVDEGLFNRAETVFRGRARARADRKSQNALKARLALRLGAGAATVGAAGAGYGGYRALRKRKKAK